MDFGLFAVIEADMIAVVRRNLLRNLLAVVDSRTEPVDIVDKMAEHHTSVVEDIPAADNIVAEDRKVVHLVQTCLPEA